MAQEIEKTKAGKALVHDTPDGKVVDYGHSMGTVFAALAHLNERLDKAEKKKGRK
jgi:hypothetical protein